jgi:hypothetical protein
MLNVGLKGHIDLIGSEFAESYDELMWLRRRVQGANWDRASKCFGNLQRYGLYEIIKEDSEVLFD